MRGILIGLALALAAPAASAQTPQQRDWCLGLGATEDQTIDGCTALIQTGRETTMHQAFAYEGRGLAYRYKGLYDQAIADYTQAIALKPDFADTYTGRAAAYERKGLRDRAIADYRTALRLDPNQTLARGGLTRLGVTP
jgi:tetratricopeptide (TPR) repeat protein